MPPEDEELIPSGDEHDDFVPAVIAHSLGEAEQYRELLADHDIPAVVGAEELERPSDDENGPARKGGISHGVPVLVPEALLDEASEVIADREEFDEFQLDAEDIENGGDDDDFGFVEATEIEAPDTEEHDTVDDEEDLFLEEDDEDLDLG